MDIEELVRRFEREIDEELTSSRDYLEAGGAQSYDQYAGLVGKITGLKRAEDIFKEVLTKLVRGDTGEEDANG